MRCNGDLFTATFVEILRNWYQACDERGLPVHVRLNRLQEMADFMETNFQPTFPPTKWINGMPVTTYEAIMQCISTRFTLYHTLGEGYNQRSISTLDIESFFSDLTRAEFTGLGMPKAVDIPRLLSRVVALNSIKHDPDRGFVYHTSSRMKYPYHTLDKAKDKFASSLETKRHGKQRKKWHNISKPGQVTRGSRPVRKHYKIDESELFMNERAGISIDIDISNI